MGDPADDDRAIAPVIEMPPREGSITSFETSTPTTIDSMTTSSSPSRRAVRDATFYCEMVIFQVELTLYKLPLARFLTDSSLFAKQCLPPDYAGQAISSATPGQREDGPVILHGVTRREFHQFVEALYPPGKLPYTRRARAKVEWLDVLKLATIWEFHEVRELAIEELDRFMKSNTIPALEKATMGKEYYVPHWLESGLKELIKREEGLGEDAFELLGTSMGTRILRQRDRHRSSCASSPESRVVLDDFEADLQAVREEYVRRRFTTPSPDSAVQDAEAVTVLSDAQVESASVAEARPHLEEEEKVNLSPTLQGGAWGQRNAVGEKKKKKKKQGNVDLS